MGIEDLIARRERLLGPGNPLFYENPVHLVRGEGVWVFDADGRRYLDCYNNVPHVGHCHPRVVEALARQAATLNTHTRYLHETILDYGEQLTAMFDAPLSTVAFVCTGTEANELAMRMANFYTGGTGIICSNWGYHGNSAAVAQISTIFPPPEGIGKHIRMIPSPGTYRGPDGVTGAALARHYADEVKRAIDGLHADGLRLSAILVDTIFSSEGLPDVPPDFMRLAVEHVRNAGGLFIADEVQPGFGRMGNHLWGYQHYGVVPDLVTLGKPMGNGHPLAGVIARPDIMSAFRNQVMYFNTFGGNPVSCAVGKAVLDVLKDERLVDNARVVGDYVIGGLKRLQQKHDLIGDVRGRGLFFGAELVRDGKTKEPATEETKRLVNSMRERGVLLSRIGQYDNVLKMRPPMPFSRDHADLVLQTLDEALFAL
ncbi:MAG: aminotransferase [Gammaproteobacteria bacterium RIFCSPLOWO2_02_FULL_61_13]|nr:MAG: aminotransferase [Gammaproteobacteria bacterium RIFCSPLOWO2_02_FULL_61_13]